VRGHVAAATSKTRDGRDYAVSIPACVVIVNAATSRPHTTGIIFIQYRRFL